jgi:hydrogenase nickel incorporation protein HypA/HybF
MHELRIATEIIETIQAEMNRRRLERIGEIGLAIGALSGVDPEALSFAFEASVTGTSLENSRMNIDFIPVEGRCLECHNEFSVYDLCFVCPKCGSGKLDIIRGQELNIVWLKTDDRDDSAKGDDHGR